MERWLNDKFPRRATLPPPGSQAKVWETYIGNSVVLNQGKCITGRNFATFTIANFLILVPSIVYLATLGPWFWREVSPALPILYAYVLIGSMVQLYKTALMDPGILPRNLDPPPIVENKPIQGDETNGSNYPFNSTSPPSNYPFGPVSNSNYPFNATSNNDPFRFGYMPDYVTVNYHGKELQSRYCNTCHSYRPLRSSHCSTCDNCVLMFDHHCPWTSNCIGVRNYKHFYFFVSLTAILAIWIFASGIAQLVLICRRCGYDFFQACGYSPAAPFCIIYGLFIGWSVVGLTGYHTYLIYGGMTTHEDIRRGHSKDKHEFDYGNAFRNFAWMVFRPTWPRLIPWKETIILPQGQIVEAT